MFGDQNSKAFWNIHGGPNQLMHDGHLADPVVSLPNTTPALSPCILPMIAQLHQNLLWKQHLWALGVFCAFVMMMVTKRLQDLPSDLRKWRWQFKIKTYIQLFQCTHFCVCLDSQEGLWRALIRLSTSMYIKQQLFVGLVPEKVWRSIAEVSVPFLSQAVGLRNPQRWSGSIISL